VQIALLSQRINELTEHFKIHKKDNHSRARPAEDGLASKKFARLLKKTNIQQYHEVVGRLGLRNSHR
jgi:small subunit ribosomal protein S15